MTDGRALAIVALLALGVAVFSVAAGPSLGVAVLSGGTAAVCSGAIAIWVLGGRVRRTPVTRTPVESETLVNLRDALSSGILGRERVLVAVRSLEWSRVGAGRTPSAPDEERRLLELPADRFRAWLSEELDRLERDT